jgi:hypothetical protein
MLLIGREQSATDFQAKEHDIGACAIEIIRVDRATKPRPVKVTLKIKLFP